jgi:CRP-like cAMP-binding protein
VTRAALAPPYKGNRIVTLLTDFESRPAFRRVSDPAPTDSCDLLMGLAPEHVIDLKLRVERHNAGTELLNPREPGRDVHIVLDGWACRHRTVGDSDRQITAFMLPGDTASCWTPIESPFDHGVRTLTPCRVMVASRERLADLARRHPVIATRLRRAMRADVAILNDWLVNLGRRKAPERIAHLLCELNFRLETARPGVHQGDHIVPLTQQDIADALGMTSVHVNRVVQKLRINHLLEIRKGSLILRDPQGLARLCDFDSTYLDFLG